MSADAPFQQRLWRSFLTARVAVATALLSLQAAALVLTQSAEPRLMAVCVAYLAATLLARALAGSDPPSPQAGPHWLPLLGVDLAAVGLLQWLQTGTMNYTPLFGLPVLLASVLGTLTLALGTTASATLMLLGAAWWQGHQRGDTQPYLQAALTGTGYFLAAYLTHHLAQRLTREQQAAQQSRQSARAQAQVNALVIENLGDGVLVLDPHLTAQVANPAALRLLGGSADPTLPLALGALPAWEPLLQMARATFATRQPQSADLGLLHPGQSPTGLRVRTWLTGDGESATPQCVMFLHDLRELEARLRTEKLAAMGRMSAAVAHEIRNPLAAIVQANALLAEDLHEPGPQRLAGIVGQNAERLARIVEEVLDIARVQHQVSYAPPATLALDEEVAQVWADWHGQGPERRHDPAQRQGPTRRSDLPRRTARVALAAPGVQVQFDAEHLRRVLINLLDNAQRFQGPHPDSLQITTQVDAAGQASLRVWSDGAPLDPSVERHLFEPFFSSHSRSSGLGLYICRELCQRHGATMTYQRQEETTERGSAGGNAFTVQFRQAARPVGTAPLFDPV